MRSVLGIILVLIFTSVYSQEDTTSKGKDFKVTQSVKKQRAMGYPLGVLDQLPVVKGCESLVESKKLLAKCMKDQFNYMYGSLIEDIQSKSKDKKGASIYIEFVIDEEGKVSEPRRVKVSEQGLDEYARLQFKKLRRKVNSENLILNPGMVGEKEVKTLYAVKFIQKF